MGKNKNIVFEKIQMLERDLADQLIDCKNMSLLDGVGGAIIFYLNLHKVTQDDIYFCKAKYLISKVIEGLQSGEEKVPHGYCNGITGIAYLFNFLQELNLFEFSIEDFMEEIENYILSEADVLLNKYRDLDFLHGGLGMGIFLINRYKKIHSNNVNIKRVLELIVELIRKDTSGEMTVNLLSTYYRNNNEFINCFNLGMAHGGSAYVIFLDKYLQLFPDDQYAKKTMEMLVERIITFYKHSDQRKKGEGAFPSIPTEGEELDYLIPLGWCYGDLTISFALLQAGKRLGKTDLVLFSKKLALDTLERDTLEKAYLKDSSFCHGTSSLAKAYQIWYNETHDFLFQEAYEHWINLTIKQGNHLDGVGGYKKFSGIEKTENNERVILTNALGILDGACGIGLVLTDYIGESDLKWEKFLLWN